MGPDPVPQEESTFKKKFFERFDFWPRDEIYYRVTFTHRSSSFPNQKKILGNHNERLEFLGDSVFGMIIAQFLFEKYPEKTEGELTEMRSKLVNRQFLNQLGKKIGLEDFLIVDQGLFSNQQTPVSLYGDVFEALIGAIYLDRGFTFTKEFIIKNLVRKNIHVEEIVEKEFNYKSRILEWAQQAKKSVEFDVFRESEIDSRPVFRAVLKIEDLPFGEGHSSRKKDAEKAAAKMAYQYLSSQKYI